MKIEDTEIITALKSLASELTYALELTKGVINGTPWVIQLSPGCYLVSRGEGFGAGSILRSACYTSERIDAAVAHVLAKAGDTFPGAKKITRREALATEIKAAEELIARFQGATA